jgi:hypothetical protein
MDELWIPVLAIICTIGLPIATGLVLGLRWMNARHNERMGLINQGIIPPDSPKKKSNPNRFVSLRNGIILVCLGIGIIVGFLLSNLSDEFRISSFFSLSASIVFFLGIGYLIYFFVTRNMTMPNENGTELSQE